MFVLVFRLVRYEVFGVCGLAGRASARRVGADEEGLTIAAAAPLPESGSGSEPASGAVGGR